MALALFDRVQETTTTTGTGAVTLDGAVPGYQSFAVVGNTNTCYYTIVDGVAWEVGVGTYSTSGPTLARTTVLSNSNGNTSPITLAVGTKIVFLTYPAGKSVNLNESGNVSPLGTVVSGIWNGTTIGVAYGGTGVTASSGANSVVLRDADQNIAVNRVNQANTNTTAAGGTTALTAASSYIHTLVGTGGQTYSLPDATTLTTGVAFVFNNLATGTLTVANFAGTTIGTIPSGGAGAVFLTLNSTVGGTWDLHAYLPEGVTFGTNAFNLGTSVISGGTWQGGTIATGYGGTGLTSYTSGGAVYANSSSTLTSGTLPITAGGTGATTAAGAQSSLNVPSTTGSGASGTWGINITGNAATATTSSSTTGNAATATRVIGGNLNPAGTAFNNALIAASGSSRVVTFDGNGNAPSVWWSNGGTAIGAIDANSGGGLNFWSNNGTSWQQQVNMTYGTFNVLTTLQRNGNTVLDAANYSSYALPLTGGIVNGQAYFRRNQTSGDYTTAPLWTESYGNTSTGIAFHISGVAGRYLEMRNNSADLFWQSAAILNAGNYNSYAPTLTGGGASGTWGINITGNASGSSTSVSATTATGIQSSYSTTINTTTPGLANYGFAFVGHGTSDYAQGMTWAWTGTNAQAGIYVQSSGAYGTKMYFGTTDSFATGSKTSMSIDHVGNVNLPRGTFSNGSVWINNGVNSNAYNENIRLFNAPNGVSVIGFSASGTSGTPTTSILGYSDRLEVRFGDGWQQRTYNGFVEAAGSFRAPIFYDSNDTTYYLDPNSSTAAILAGSVGIGTTSPVNTAWGNASNTKQITVYGSGYGVLNLRGDNAASTWYSMGVGDSRFYAAYDNINAVHRLVFQGNNTGFNNVTTPAYNIHLSGTGYATSDWRAPIFYDSDDTGYYLNPNSLSNINNLQTAGQVVIGGTFGNNAFNSVASTRLMFGGGNEPNTYFIGTNLENYGGNYTKLDIRWHTGIRMGARPGYGGIRFFEDETIGTQIFAIGKDGSFAQANQSMRAPIFYDLDDTGYYLDPTSTSQSALRVRGGGLFGPNPTWGTYLLVGGDGRNGYIDNTSVASVCSTNGNLHIDAASGSGTYINFYDGNIVNFGNGASAIVSTINTDGSHRAVIFYDYNNTAYYCDPSGLSNLLRVACGFDAGVNNSVSCSDWFRSSGNTGWYNATYGGGVYMIDSTWVRAYNGTSFLSDNIVQGQASVRAPIFYDSEDTNYYLNPNSTSLLYRGRFGPFAGSQSGNTSALEIMNAGGTGDANLANITFHCQSYYGTSLHLRADGYFGVGGWSATTWRWYTYLANGDMTAAGNVTAYSDPRLKTDITPIQSALSIIQQLNGVRFKWIESSVIGHPGEYDYGVLADEVQKVLPELVSDSMHEAPEGDKYKTVAYDKFAPILIESVKELAKYVTALEQRIAQLEARF